MFREHNVRDLWSGLGYGIKTNSVKRISFFIHFFRIFEALAVQIQKITENSFD